MRLCFWHSSTTERLMSFQNEIIDLDNVRSSLTFIRRNMHFWSCSSCGRSRYFLKNMFLHMHTRHFGRVIANQTNILQRTLSASCYTNSQLLTGPSTSRDYHSHNLSIGALTETWNRLSSSSKRELFSKLSKCLATWKPLRGRYQK